MFQNHRHRYQLFMLVMIAALAFSAHALKKDNKEVLHINANTTIYNYKKGLNYFEGNVKIDQGTTHVTADRLTTKANDKHEIEEAIAYGVHDLAHFWTLAKEGQPVINAHARIIKFYPLTSNATLQGEVFVTQGENNFQGQLIHYNMKDQTIIVPETKNGRAVLVYNPD